MLRFLCRAPLALLRFLCRIVVVPLLLALVGRLHEWLYVIALITAAVVGAALFPLWLRLMAACGEWWWVPLLVGWVAMNRFEKEIFIALCRWAIEKATPTSTELRGRELD